jgi:hypothetical protein
MNKAVIDFPPGAYRIKTTTTVNQFDVKAKSGFSIDKDAGPPPSATVDSSRLKSMLAGLKSKAE